MPSTVKQLEWNGSTEVLAKYAERDTKGRKISEIEGYTTLKADSIYIINTAPGIYKITPQTAGRQYIYVYYNGTDTTKYIYVNTYSNTTSGERWAILEVIPFGQDRIFWIRSASETIIEGYSSPSYGRYKNVYVSGLLSADYSYDKDNPEGIRLYRHTAYIKFTSNDYPRLQISWISPESVAPDGYLIEMIAHSYCDGENIRYFPNASHCGYLAKITSVNYTNHTISGYYSASSSFTTLNVTTSGNVTTVSTPIDYLTFGWMND